ncbi:MAG: hypothetical protein ACR2PT_20915 [Endozoicomonas sp.]
MKPELNYIGHIQTSYTTIADCPNNIWVFRSHPPPYSGNIRHSIPVTSGH